jgi:hypothetical protein
MNSYLNQNLEDLESALFYFQKGTSGSLERALQILDDLFLKTSDSHHTYLEITPHLFNVLERFDAIYINVLLITYLENNNRPTNLNRIPYTDFLTKHELSIDFQNKANTILMQIIKNQNVTPRNYMDGKIGWESLISSEKDQWLAFLESMIDESFGVKNWGKANTELSLFIVELLREIAKSINSHEVSYFNFSIVLERLVNTKQFDLTKRILDTIIQVSYLDNLSEFGFYIHARYYRRIGNTTLALLMLCICIKKINLKHNVNDNLYRLFNEGFFELAGLVGDQKTFRKLFGFIDQTFKLSSYQDANLKIKYYANLIQFGLINESDILTLLDYIKGNDAIFKSKANLGLPYLNLVFSIKTNFPKFEHIQLFDPILADLKKQVGENEYFNLEKLYSGHYQFFLLAYFNDLQSQLNKVTNITEVETILRTQLGQITILHNSNVKDSNTNGYLAAMRFKTDYALSMKLKEDNHSIEAENENIDFNDYRNYMESNFRQNSSEITYISTDHEQLYSLQFDKAGFTQILQIKDWSIEKLDAWLIEIKKYMEGNKAITNNSKILKLFLGIHLSKAKDSKQIQIVKDIWLSKFPHNLFIYDDGDFIILDKPVTDVISAEWLIKHTSIALKDFSIQAYVPIEDFVIRRDIYQNNRFQKTINKFNVTLETATIPSSPLSGSINIFVAHGNSNIADFFALEIGGATIVDMNKVIGNGQIAILFVCGAGYQKISNYSHKIASFVRLLFLKNYEAVIAPAWDLYTYVPPIWLSEFLMNMEMRNTVGQSFQAATKKVYLVKKDPTYWACLHLYGNPNLRLY